MGCFFSCYRSWDRDQSVQSIPRGCYSWDAYYDLECLQEQLVVENLLGFFFLNDEQDMEDDLGHCTLEDELRLEAKHLKLCGAILETPMEIRQPSKRKACRELNGSDQSPVSVHTLPNKKIQLGMNCEQAITGTPGLERENSISHQNTPGTGSPEETQVGKLDLTPVRHGTVFRSSDPNSPFSTPPTLTDEMQTPGTIYSSYQDTAVSGKWARILVQYAYPALKTENEVEISSNIKLVKLEKENEVAGEFCFHTKHISEENSKVLVSSLSEWLKPINALRGRSGTLNIAREIPGGSQVKMHGTPFKERFERVLSDKKTPSPRKLSQRLIEFEE